MNIDYAIIAAGGKATRFLPYSLVMPKELLPLNGIPAIQYAIDECIAAKIHKIIIITRPNNNLIAQHLSHHENYRKFIVESFNSESKTQILILPENEKLPYGNAAPLITVRHIIGDSRFVVLFADDIILGNNPTIELNDFLNSHPDCLSIVGYQTVPLFEVHNYGNIETNEEDEILKIRQKPKDLIISNKVIVSRLLLNGSIFDYIEKKSNNELDLGLAVNSQLQQNPHKVFGCNLSGLWICIDTPEKYLKALNNQQDFLNLKR